MASTSDWILGQKLVAAGICTLEQVRDALAEADRTRRPFGEILVDLGVSAERLRGAGLEIAQRPLTTRRRVKLAAAKPARWPWVLLTLAVFGAGGWWLTRPDPEIKAVEIDPDQAPREELEKITAEEDVEKAPDIARRYADYGRRWAGLKWELEAGRRRDAFLAKVEEPARAALEALAPREAELLAAGKIADALRLYLEYPAKYLDSPSGQAVRAKMAELDQRARAAYATGRAEAEALLKDGKFAAAEERVAQLPSVAAAEAAPEIEELRLRIDREARGARGKAKQEVADKYLEVDVRVRERLARRPPRPADAAREIVAFLSAPWDELRAPFVRPGGADPAALKKAVEEWDPAALRALAEAAMPEVESPDRLSTGEAALLDLRAAALVEQFYRDVQSAMKKAVESGQELELPGLGKGRFEKRGESTVFTGESEGKPLSDEDLAALAAREGGEERDLKAGMFFFFCSSGREAKAYDHLEKARLTGAKGVKVYLTGLYLARGVELAKSLRTKFETAEEVFKAKQWPATKKLLGEMLEHAEHPYVKEKRPLIEKMLFEIADGSDAERRLSAKLKGRASALPDGRTRVVYDFESAEQIDGFASPGEEESRAFPGRWRVVEGALESAARQASVIRWKTPIKGDVEVAYDLTPIEEPQNVTAALYARKEGPGHYAVVLGFDWVGRGEGDRDNSAEDRNAMPRACVLKYPVKADKARWREADEWERWRERLVGERKAREPIRLALGKTVRVAVRREGALLRVLVDGDPYWSGEDAEFGEGELVFFSDSRCRLEAVAITGRFE